MVEKIIGIAFVAYGSLILAPTGEQLAGILMLVIGVTIIVGKIKES